MTVIFRKYLSSSFFILFILGLYVTGVLIASHATLDYRSYLDSFALPFDFMVIIPILFYIFIIRKYHLSPLLVLPVIWLGSVITTQIVRPEDLRFILVLGVVALVVEATIVVREISRGVTAFKSARQLSVDPYVWFLAACSTLIRKKKFAKLPAMEFTMMYYAFLSWGKAGLVPAGAKDFSYHKKSGYSALVGVLAGVSVIEIGGLHLLLSQWSIEAAWALTILSIYFIFWIVGNLRASILRPVLVLESTIEVNSGLIFSIQIPIKAISQISSKDPAFSKKQTVNLGTMGSANCWVVLDEAIETETFFGAKRQTRALGLSLDDVAGFRKAMYENLEALDN